MQARGERRKNPYVLFVRDWITTLRASGGDFDPVAAERANEAAFAAMKVGQDPDHIFQVARHVYYAELKTATKKVTAPSIAA